VKTILLLAILLKGVKSISFMTKQHHFGGGADLAQKIKIKMDYSVNTILFWEKKIPKLFLNEKFSPHLDQWFFFSNL